MKQAYAVIYARYSSHGQTEQSIEGQLHDAYAYAAREGYVVIGEYIDRALTGRTDNRADFQRMIMDSGRKQFQTVLVWKLDRFARNRYDSAIYKAKLKKNGVRVVSVMENVNDSPEGIILEGMLESMAEYYSANLSVNVKRGQRETLSKGRYCGGRVPYGYRVEDGKLVQDEKTAPIVRFIYEQYALGVSKKDIIAQLKDRNILSPEGKQLTTNSFAHVLVNPIYYGAYVRTGTSYDACSEPIVDRDLYDKVQIMLGRHKRAPAASKAKEDYMLQGKVFCGHCGSPMNGESGRSHTGTRYYYYACSKKKKQRACKKRNERKDVVETFVVRNTINYVLDPKNMQRIAQAVAAEYQAEFTDTKLPEMQKAIKRIDHELNKLVDALIDAPKVAQKRIYERMELLEAQKSDLEIDLAKQQIASRITYTEEEIMAWLQQFCSGSIEDPDYCQLIIDTFVNSVFLYDDRILIIYNARGGTTEIPTPAAITTATSKGSDFIALAPPSENKSEPVMIIMRDVFGFVFHFDRNELS